jgi:hypothetical protein
MAQDSQKQRNQLIRKALLAAAQRMDQSPKPDDVFAPIGELVFWIVAADEGLRKQYGQTYTSWRNNHQHGHLFPPSGTSATRSLTSPRHGTTKARTSTPTGTPTGMAHGCGSSSLHQNRRTRKAGMCSSTPTCRTCGTSR